jgi:acyl dehydratase
LKVGDTIKWQKTFIKEDIQLFGRLSGDEGIQHMTPDEQGRIMVQGLLTATLPTKIGGDLNFIARQMTFQFIRPVYAGDTITCEVTILNLEQTEQFLKVESKWVCRNQHDKEVLTGNAVGIIKDSAKLPA